MGESTGDRLNVDKSPLRFTAIVDGETIEYPGPYDVTTTEGYRDFYWDTGFITGFAAALGTRPKEITILVYQGDKLIETK